MDLNTKEVADMNGFINTINFGYVPVRRNYTEGRHLADIELSDDGTNACFAEIRADYKTEQPFAVLFDKNWHQL